MSRRVSWSGLPEELLTKIGECLDTRFDIIRFRSVCRLWRSSLPFSHKIWHLQPCLSESSGSELCRFECSSTIVRTIVCILNQSPISTPCLLKLEETGQGKPLILNPISDSLVKYLPTPFPKFLNLLDYPILELSRGYIVKVTVICRLRWDIHVTTSVFRSKVVILPESDRITIADDFMFLTLSVYGRLLLGRNGDNKDLRPINEDWFHYDDIAVYRGRFVAIDRRGIVSFVDSTSSKLMQLTPPVLNGSQKKHLVVSSEHLYAVRYFDGPRTTHNPYGEEDAKVVSFKVYKLDEELGWIEITRLDDRILIVGDGLNFFVPIKDLSGCRGNYIYFKDENHWYKLHNNEVGELIRSTCLSCHGIAVFDMVDQSIGKLSSFPGCSDVVWPPPSWFTAN